MRQGNRRNFIITVAAGGGALMAAQRTAQAADAPVLTETDPQAVALGYKVDTTQVDKAKYPQHTPAQACSGCNFYQGKAGDKMGPCQLFAGKLVHPNGWCSGYAKKA